MLKFVQCTSPLRSAASTSSAVWAEVSASGFSQTTCLPALSVASACAWWTWFGLVMCTTSMLSSSSIASRLSYGSGRPGFARARSGDEPTTPATSIPRRRNASTCTTPMNPVPTTPALIARA